MDPLSPLQQLSAELGLMLLIFYFIRKLLVKTPVPSEAVPSKVFLFL